MKSQSITIQHLKNTILIIALNMKDNIIGVLVLRTIPQVGQQTVLPIVLLLEIMTAYQIKVHSQKIIIKHGENDEKTIILKIKFLFFYDFLMFRDILQLQQIFLQDFDQVPTKISCFFMKIISFSYFLSEVYL